MTIDLLNNVKAVSSGEGDLGVFYRDGQDEQDRGE